MPNAESTAFTLDDLHAKLGAPDQALTDAVVDEDNREQFVALGAQIASRHILSDAPRIYGIAYQFLETASESQRDMIDVSKKLIAVGVHLALKLRALHDGTRKSTGENDAARSQAEREAQRTFSEGLGLRNRTEKLLKGIVGRDPDARKRVDDHTGTAENAEALAQGLLQQATLLRELLGHKNDKIAARIALYEVTPERADKLDAAAARIRDTAKAADARSVAKVRQLEIDFMDGVNLHVLGELIQAFEAAHDMDASIPRLVPIATRRLLSRSTSRRAAQEAPTEPPAQEG